MLHPEGALFWCLPTNLEPGNTYSSKYPDVFVDGDDKVHVTWLEKREGLYEVKYINLDTDGTVLLPLMTATSSANEKRDLNIVTDFSHDPRIIYSQKDVNDWDIWWVVYTNGVWGASQPLIVDNGYDQIKPSADVGETAFENGNMLYIAYQEKGINDADNKWEIWLYNDQVQPNKKRLTFNEFEEVNPNLCVERHWRNVYIVWTVRSLGGLVEGIEMAIINGFDLQSKSYGSGPGLGVVPRHVGLTAVGIAKEYPKVSATEIISPYTGFDRARAIQVNVIWREYVPDEDEWFVHGSIFTIDGRCLTPGKQKALFPCYHGIPQITGSQVRKITQAYNWLDYDGNFRLLYYNFHNNKFDLLLASTRENWAPVDSLRGMADLPQKNPHMDIDELGGLHVAYEHFDDGTNRNWIVYGYFPLETSGGRDPDRDPWFIISDIDHDCVNPQVVGIHRNPTLVPEAIIIYKDMDEGSEGELMFQRVDADGGFYARHILKCTEWAGQTYEPHGHRVVYNPRKSEIGVVWSEYTVSSSSIDIHFGIVDVWNSQVIHESSDMVVGTDSLDFRPDMDIDCIGNYHIVYESGSIIYYNMVKYDWNEDEYTRSFSSDIMVSDDSEVSEHPSICVDRGFHRRIETTWDTPISYAGDEELGRTHRFAHISFSRYMSNQDNYILRYVKINNQGNIVIPEKDVPFIPWDPPWTRTVYCSDVEIKSQVLVNEDNQVVIVSNGKIHHGSKWRNLHTNYGVFFTKLDNNGDVITTETYISDDPSNHGCYPSADYYYDKDFDTYDRLEIVWMYSTANGEIIRHRQEVGYVV